MMSDLRTTVEDNRGMLKKIQLVIPRYREYRLREDLRIADNLLRVYLADTMHSHVQNSIERAIEALSASNELNVLGEVGKIGATVKGLEAKIRHAEQGYSGISPADVISEKNLNRLYEYDLKIITLLADLQRRTEVLLNCAECNNLPELRKTLIDMRKMTDTLSEALAGRRTLHMDIPGNSSKEE